MTGVLNILTDEDLVLFNKKGFNLGYNNILFIATQLDSKDEVIEIVEKMHALYEKKLISPRRMVSRLNLKVEFNSVFSVFSRTFLGNNQDDLNRIRKSIIKVILNTSITSYDSYHYSDDCKSESRLMKKCVSHLLKNNSTSEEICQFLEGMEELAVFHKFPKKFLRILKLNTKIDKHVKTKSKDELNLAVKIHYISATESCIYSRRKYGTQLIKKFNKVFDLLMNSSDIMLDYSQIWNKYFINSKERNNMIIGDFKFSLEDAVELVEIYGLGPVDLIENIDRNIHFKDRLEFERQKSIAA